MTLTQEEVLEQIEHTIDFRVQTSIPAVVTNVDDFEEKQFVRVRPLINETFEDYLALQPSEIFSVPVVFPSAGGGILSFPIQVGDTVMLLFSKEKIGEWLQGEGGQTTPETFGKFAITDAVAIAGLYTSKSNLNPNPVDTELRFANNHIILRKSGDIDIKVVKNWNIDVGIEPEEGEEPEENTGVVNLTSVGDINVSTGGTVNVTAAKNLNILLGEDGEDPNPDTGNMEVTASSDINLTVAGNLKADVSGDVDVMAGGAVEITSGGNMSLVSGGSLTISAVGQVDIDGSTINLN